MSDQIAPSLATELEQAAKELRAVVEDLADGCFHTGEKRNAQCCVDMAHATATEDAIALLTRAAALAKAAEKVADARSREQIASTIQELRALVSGKGE